MDGKTALGASSPANPALHIPDPLSTTRAATSSSHMLVPMNTQNGLTVGMIENIHNVYYQYLYLYTKARGCRFVCLYSYNFKTAELIGLRDASTYSGNG